MVSIFGLSVTVVPAVCYVCKPILDMIMNVLVAVGTMIRDAIVYVSELVFKYVLLLLFKYGYVEFLAYLSCF